MEKAAPGQGWVLTGKARRGPPGKQRDLAATLLRAPAATSRRQRKGRAAHVPRQTRRGPSWGARYGQQYCRAGPCRRQGAALFSIDYSARCMSPLGYKCASGATENLVRCTPSSGPSRLELPLSPTTGMIWPARVGPILTHLRHSAALQDDLAAPFPLRPKLAHRTLPPPRGEGMYGRGQT